MNRIDGVKEAINQHGIEAALILLTQNGYLHWAEGKEVKEEDINHVVCDVMNLEPRFTKNLFGVS